jgi:hypothetical protein
MRTGVTPATNHQNETFNYFHIESFQKGAMRDEVGGGSSSGKAPRPAHDGFRALIFRRKSKNKEPS